MNSANEKMITTLPKCGFDDRMEILGITNDNVEQFDIALISIVGTHGLDAYNLPETPFFNKNYFNVLNLVFDDCEEDRIEETSSTGTQKAMSLSQAKEVVDFVIRNQNKSKFLIHCAAGQSRSGGVATFISDILGQDYQIFKSRNPYIYPNGQVIAQLNRVIREMVDSYYNEYQENHTHCPKCNSVDLNVTEKFCIPHHLHLESFIDDNIATCCICNHQTIVHKLT